MQALVDASVAMLRKLSPSFFFGSAAAAAAGLALGFALHGPWDSFNGAIAPEILFSSAQAAEIVKRPNAADADTPAFEPVAPAQDDAAADPAVLYAGYGPADPLPVTRLAPGPDPLANSPVQEAGVNDDSRTMQGEDIADPEPARSEPAQADPTPAPTYSPRAASVSEREDPSAG